MRLKNITESYTIKYSKYSLTNEWSLYGSPIMYIFYTWRKFGLLVWTESLWKRTGLRSARSLTFSFANWLSLSFVFWLRKNFKGETVIFDRESWSWPMTGMKKNREKRNGNNWGNVMQRTSFLRYSMKNEFPCFYFLHYYIFIIKFLYFKYFREESWLS